MNTQVATELLDRYFEGETTLAEERALASYFADATNVAPELRQYAPLFAYWAREREVQPDNLVPFRPPVVRRRLVVGYSLAATVAACLLLVAGWFVLPQLSGENRLAGTEKIDAPIDWSKYEVTDEREAIRLLHRSLKPAGRTEPITR